MLTESEKSRIRTEEIFRNEVREDIARDRPDRTPRWYSWLSSSLGIWFLSTIVVGLATYSFTWNESRLKAAAEKEKRIQEIDIEISTRVRMLVTALDAQVDSDEGSFQLLLGGFSELPMSTSSTPNSPGRPSITLLLWELEGLVPEKEKEEVGKALLLAEELARLLTTNMMEVMGGGFLDEANIDWSNIDLILSGLLKVDRWQRLSAGGKNIHQQLVERREQLYDELEAEYAASEAVWQKKREENLRAANNMLSKLTTVEYSVSLEDESVSAVIENASERNFQSISGFVVVEDLLGREILKEEFSVYETLKTKQRSRVNVSIGYVNERFKKALAIGSSKVLVVVFPTKIAYEANDVEEFDGYLP